MPPAEILRDSGAVASWFPYAYPIEIAQLVFATAGVYYSIRGTYDAWQDVQYVKRSGMNGARAFVARRNLFEEAIRLVVHILMFGNGLIIVTYPPPEPGLVLPADRYFQLMVTRWVLTLTSILLTAKSFQDVRDRRYVRDILRARMDGSTRH